jgi:pimeloyl-ACP methyl ester carboxylesterase
MIAMLLIALAIDSVSTVRRIPLAPSETLTVTIATPAPPPLPTAFDGNDSLVVPALLTLASGRSATPAHATESLPIVLLPGLIGGVFGYRKVTPALTAAGHVSYVIELLGTGSSSHPDDGDYSLDAQADRVAATLDSLGVGSAIIAGSNFAASVALRVAYRRPEHVAAVMLLDGGPVDRSYTQGVSAAMKLGPLVKLFGGRGVATRHIRDALKESSADAAWVTRDVVREYARPIVHDLGATADVMNAMRRASVSSRLVDNLDRIAQPVRLMIGAANRSHGIRPEEVALLGERLHNLAIDSVDGSGVYLAEERPDAVAAELLALSDSLASGATVAASLPIAVHFPHSTKEAP